MFPFGERRHGGPQLVIRGKHPWLVSRRQAIPVLPRLRDEMGELSQELKRRELDEAARSRLRGFS